MARLEVEDEGLIDAALDDARRRLPGAMERLGYAPAGDGVWKRRPDRCGWAGWSLPDSCPATASVALEPGGDRRTRIRVRYDVRMTGQILANTDAKALELEADRLRALLCDEVEPDTRAERARLSRLTLGANLALSMAPAAAFAAAAWPVVRGARGLSTTRALGMAVGLGAIAWIAALAIMSRVVVTVLNARVATRVRWRAGG